MTSFQYIPLFTFDLLVHILGMVPFVSFQGQVVAQGTRLPDFFSICPTSSGGGTTLWFDAGEDGLWSLMFAFMTASFFYSCMMVGHGYERTYLRTHGKQGNIAMTLNISQACYVLVLGLIVHERCHIIHHLGVTHYERSM